MSHGATDRRGFLKLLAALVPLGAVAAVARPEIQPKLAQSGYVHVDTLPPESEWRTWEEVQVVTTGDRSTDFEITRPFTLQPGERNEFGETARKIWEHAR